MPRLQHLEAFPQAPHAIFEGAVTSDIYAQSLTILQVAAAYEAQAQAYRADLVGHTEQGRPFPKLSSDFRCASDGFSGKSTRPGSLHT